MLKVCLTGGPCSGKTTILSILTQVLEGRGYTCLVCEEAASSVILGGIKPYKNGMTMEEFQQFVLDKQIANEALFDMSAQYFNKDKLVIFYDRGLCDQMAYVSTEYLQSLLNKYNISLSDAYSRYDCVFHLVTAAKGAREHYVWNDPSKEDVGNNAARYETPEEAIALDERTLNAWVGHPHLRVFDNTTTFDGKVQRVIEELFSALGEPIPKEIERKFLIKKPTEKEIEQLGCISKSNIIQTYLVRNDVSIERRIRQRGTKDTGYSFYYTEKKDIGNGERFESEEKISQSEYISLLIESDPKLHPIIKTRYCFMHDNRHFEMDIYPFDDEYAILEIEVNHIDEEINMPNVNVIKETTFDNRYKNNIIARTMTIKP